MTLAAACGVILVSIVSLVIGLGFIGTLATLGKTKPVLPSSGILTIDLSRVTIAEQSSETFDVNSLLKPTNTTIGLLDAIRCLELAAVDPAVKCVYLKTDGSTTGFAALEELREAIAQFRQNSGKAVISYIESPSTSSYYLSSVADKVYMTSHIGATTMFNGISSQSFYLGDLLKRFKVNVQLIRHGKYKSAGEMYTRSSSSPENKLQNQEMVSSLWNTVSSQIAQSRGITVESLNDAIDNLRLTLPEDFVSYGLVDELYDHAGLEEKMTVFAEVSDYKDVNFIPFEDYYEVKLAGQISLSDKQIAVIYVDGQIIDNEIQGGVEGNKFAAIINSVREDDSVKAVVLRVNSPGGSVLASEKIKAALDRLKEEKTLVASYGDYAASGGYWISANCDKIYTDATTLTGSIGVFSMIPDLSLTAKDVLHVGIESTNSNKHSDLYSLTKTLDQSEYNYMQKTIEAVYDKFTSIVSIGRGLPVATVDSVGQGRVWTGANALDINLVDEIGGLKDALIYTAAQAGDPNLSSWGIVEYPKPLTDFEQIMAMIENVNKDTDPLVKVFGSYKDPQIWARMEQIYLVK